jgi:hypothetical protein
MVSEHPSIYFLVSTSLQQLIASTFSLSTCIPIDA